MSRDHSTAAAFEAQYADIAERLKRCDPEDVAWIFGTIGNLMARVAKAEARLAQIEPQQNYQILEADA